MAVSDPRRRDVELGALAERQHGVVARAQLLALGLSETGVRARVAAGRLHAIHTGVYAVGHRSLTVEGRWTAAVLTCGRGAALSHRSAGALWGLLQTARPAIDVTTPTRAGRVRPGIDVHRSRSLPSSDVTAARGVACTTVARTLLDLADVSDRRMLERACEQAEVLRLLDRRALEDVLGRARGRRGSPLLRVVLADLRAGETVTRSELEERFLALCAASHLARPLVNAHVPLEHGGLEVDFTWPAHRLVVETDGFAAHRTRRAFEHDRARDQRLIAAGWRVVRCTWRQVSEQPRQLVALLDGLLAE